MPVDNSAPGAGQPGTPDEQVIPAAEKSPASGAPVWRRLATNAFLIGVGVLLCCLWPNLKDKFWSKDSALIREDILEQIDRASASLNKLRQISPKTESEAQSLTSAADRELNQIKELGSKLRTQAKDASDKADSAQTDLINAVTSGTSTQSAQKTLDNAKKEGADASAAVAKADQATILATAFQQDITQKAGSVKANSGKPQTSKSPVSVVKVWDFDSGNFLSWDTKTKLTERSNEKLTVGPSRMIQVDLGILPGVVATIDNVNVKLTPHKNVNSTPDLKPADLKLDKVRPSTPNGNPDPSKGMVIIKPDVMAGDYILTAGWADTSTPIAAQQSSIVGQVILTVPEPKVSADLNKPVGGASATYHPNPEQTQTRADFGVPRNLMAVVGQFGNEFAQTEARAGDAPAAADLTADPTWAADAAPERRESVPAQLVAHRSHLKVDCRTTETNPNASPGAAAACPSRAEPPNGSGLSEDCEDINNGDARPRIVRIADGEFGAMLPACRGPVYVRSCELRVELANLDDGRNDEIVLILQGVSNVGLIERTSELKLEPSTIKPTGGKWGGITPLYRFAKLPPGKYRLFAKVKHNNVWFTTESCNFVVLQSSIRIVGIADGEFGALLPACRGPVQIRSGELRVELANLDDALDEIVLILQDVSNVGLSDRTDKLILDPSTIKPTDAKWGGSTRPVRFSKLPPGMYALRAMVKHNDVWSTTESCNSVELQSSAVFARIRAGNDPGLHTIVGSAGCTGSLHAALADLSEKYAENERAAAVLQRAEELDNSAFGKAAEVKTYTETNLRNAHIAQNKASEAYRTAQKNVETAILIAVDPVSAVENVGVLAGKATEATKSAAMAEAELQGAENRADVTSAAAKKAAEQSAKEIDDQSAKARDAAAALAKAAKEQFAKAKTVATRAREKQRAAYAALAKAVGVAHPAHAGKGADAAGDSQSDATAAADPDLDPDDCCREEDPSKSMNPAKNEIIREFVIATAANFPRPGFDRGFKHYGLDGAVIYENMKLTISDKDGKYEIRYCVTTPETVQLRMQVLVHVYDPVDRIDNWYTLTLPVKSIPFTEDNLGTDGYPPRQVVIRGRAPYLAGRVCKIREVSRRGTARFGSRPPDDDSNEPTGPSMSGDGSTAVTVSGGNAGG